ncbi:MAG TPA: cellulase family glycosylhydrolase [Balneolaceae bacterium]
MAFLKTYLAPLLLLFIQLFNQGAPAAKSSVPLTKKFPDAFVQAKGNDFVINGHKFRFVGTNAYYLPNYQKIKPEFVEKTLDIFEKAGITVVRTWGFYDGPPQFENDITLQPRPGAYSEENLRYLDQLIAMGKKRGIRFIITLINYWEELGGVPQYNEWDGHPDAGMKHFINDPDTQRWYKNYIKMLLNRTNTVTGVKYKNEPAIFSWEIMNEGRLPDGDPTELRDWYREIAQYIKSIDPNHMVATGEEGQEVKMNSPASPYSVDQYSNTYVLRSGIGSSYILNTAIPEIDYGTAHWYPNGWGFGHKADADLLKAQRAWIYDHAKIAAELGKPFVLGEYGFSGWGDESVLEVYNHLWAYAEKIELDGSLLWQLTTNHIKCYEYGGNICWPGARRDQRLYQEFTVHINNVTNGVSG